MKAILAELEASIEELEAILASNDARADLSGWLGEHRRRISSARRQLEGGGTPNRTNDVLAALGQVSQAAEDDSVGVALGSLMQLTQAQRGFIVLRARDGSLSFPAARTFSALDVNAPEAQLSRTILQTALNGESSVMVVDAREDARFAKQASVQALALRAVLAVPLITGGRTFGALYLDNPIRAGAFSDEARDSAEQLARIIGPILERDLALREADRQHLDRVQRLREQFDFSATIGESDALIDLLAIVGRVAPTDAAVLISGETGSGKEVIAQSLHANSRRAKKPFVALNCGALPSELIESELFGHERGAFTGAVGARVGRFEAADGGTLFLDEIGELAADAQAKLLRVLADGSFQRVGTSTTRHADVRIVAATNRNLDDEVKAGRFRHDLLYRLNVIPLQVPPLRERDGDVPLLAMHFLQSFSRAHGREGMTIHPSAMEILEEHQWPGNVRELANVIERGVVMSSGRELMPTALLQISSGPVKPADADMKSAVRAYKRRLVERALATSKGDNASAARILGVHPKYLYQLIRELEPSSAPTASAE